MRRVWALIHPRVLPFPMVLCVLPIWRGFAKERWEVLSEDEQEKFAPICPDFVVELLSRTDRLETIKDKMQEYIDNGTQLGWLIDPREQNVYVYRPDKEVVCLSDPETIFGRSPVAQFCTRCPQALGNR